MRPRSAEEALATYYRHREERDTAGVSEVRDDVAFVKSISWTQEEHFKAYLDWVFGPPPDGIKKEWKGLSEFLGKKSSPIKDLEDLQNKMKYGAMAPGYTFYGEPETSIHP